MRIATRQKSPNLQLAAASPQMERVSLPVGWTRTFTDPRLCAAIVDRLTYGGHIIETGTTSYRLAHARSRRSQNPRNA